VLNRIAATVLALGLTTSVYAQEEERTLTRTKGPNTLQMPKQKTLTRTKPVRKVGKKLVPVSATVMTGVASLFNAIKAKLTLRKNKTELDVILADTKNGGREFFRNFAESEWSGENFNALAAIRGYRAAPTVTKLDAMLKTYFSKGAAQEVNARAQEFQALKQARLPVRGSTITPEVKAALEALEKALMINLSDTYSRFAVSDNAAYREWQRRRSVGGKLVDGVRKLDHNTLQVEKTVHDVKTLGKDVGDGIKSAGQGVKKALTRKKSVRKPVQQQE
jgi:hypothetical protein